MTAPARDRLEVQVRRLLSENDIRGAMARYMTLCDSLDASTPLDELVGLFSEDAIWEGKGRRYGASFGRVQGRAQLADMFKRYMSDPPHFSMNVHFLCSEHIQVSEDDATASGGWVMLQTSTFSSGASHLNAARLTTRWRREAVEGERWRIAHFQTENLFSRPARSWDDEAELPVPKS